MESQLKALADCFHSNRQFILDLMTSGEVIKPGVAAIIATRNPGWNAANLIAR